MSVEEGDTVTIITDNDHLTEADALARIVVEHGGFPVVCNNEHQVKRAIADMTFPMAPPRNLHQAMVTSDEIIIITNLEWANRFAHVSAVRESCDNNAKIASVEEGIGSWNMTKADIIDATDRAKAAIAALDGAKWCRVTSPAGTDVRVCIEGRPALEVTPIKKRGQMMGPIPLWAEVAFAAVEDKTEGRIVVDGIMLGIGLPGQTPNPIEWRVQGGKAVSIEGGEEAERLKKVIDGVDGATVIGEFAFGTSEKSPTGSPSEKGSARHRPFRPRRQSQRLSWRPECQPSASRRQLSERLPPDRGDRAVRRQGWEVGVVGNGHGHWALGTGHWNHCSSS